MTPSRFNVAMLGLATVLSGGCATTLYDTLLEGADRIIAIHTAKDQTRPAVSNSGETMRANVSMNEIRDTAMPNTTNQAAEKVYRARTVSVDIQQRAPASMVVSGPGQDSGSQNSPPPLTLVARTDELSQTNSLKPLGYGDQYRAGQVKGNAQGEPEANSRETIEAIDALMMARSRGENSNAHGTTGSTPASEYASGLPLGSSTCAQLERELWSAYRAFDFETVEHKAPLLVGHSAATVRQVATARFLAGAAAYLRGDVRQAQALFRQAVQIDNLFLPDPTVFPGHMIEFFKKVIATADSKSR